jgi:hypothetical protein
MTTSALWFSGMVKFCCCCVPPGVPKSVLHKNWMMTCGA